LNEEARLGACLDSVFGQEWARDRYEVIVADNGSKDRSVEIALEKGAAVVKGSRRGVAAARNAGVAAARGEIIVSIDADCVAAPGWLEGMVKGFDDPGIGCVAGAIEPLEELRTSELRQFLIEKKFLSQEQHVRHPFLPFAATANAAYRREVFGRIGLYDEELRSGEDKDLCWRMQLETVLRVVYVPEAVVFHPYETDAKALFRQKRTHAYGQVALFKKYRRQMKGKRKTLKEAYWEYRSLLRRGVRLFLGRTAGAPERNQVLLEFSWKAGLIHGSIAHRVWYV
jgi:cellulose synthase/poly-beta-1,6-N-acetylglucosamine synthase-like glycosyltransferase